MSAIALQGRIFVAIACSLTAAVLLFGPLDPAAELWLAAALILLLGVPHGALDVRYARAILGVQSMAGWAGFVLLYLLIAAVIVWCWQANPGLFFLAFLLVSAAHFSGDLANGTPWPIRLLYGGAVLVLPHLQHAVETQFLFAALVGPLPAASLSAALSTLAIPWLVALLAAIAHASRRHRATAAEMAALALLVVVLPPLSAFTVYFCLMHSPRHLLRTAERYQLTPRSMALTAVPPMLGVVLLVLLLWPQMAMLTGSRLFEVQLLTLVFVGLAALTVPHMLLVERVRFGALPVRVRP